MSSIGSITAKGGFNNEKDIVHKFNNWKTELIAQEWLKKMNYIIEEIEHVEAILLSKQYKTDVQIQVKIKLKKAIACENLSIKLVSNKRGFNQIDKRRVTKYKELWNFSKNIEKTLKLYTGEIPPYKNTRDKRRMFLDEMEQKDIDELIEFLKKNKILIISDIIRGRGDFSAGWMLVIRNYNDNYEWILKNINEVMNFYGNGDIKITPKGNLKIGKITMQRKGGDGGKETGRMLQFKLDPSDLMNCK